MAVRAGDLARRLGGAIGIAAEGVTMASAVLAAGVLALVLGWPGAGTVAILCGLAIAAFFRDPERSPAVASERLVLSGAIVYRSSCRRSTCTSIARRSAARS